MDIVHEIISLAVWVVANVVYLDSVRRGRGGFRRLVAFWMGVPGTVLSKILVKEGSQPDLRPSPEADEALLDEVRRSRAVGPGEEGDTENREEER